LLDKSLNLKNFEKGKIFDKTNLIPKKILFDNPERSSPRISPDGEKLAYLASYKGTLNVFVDFFDGKNENITSDNDRGISSYYWHYDNEHIFYIQDIKGDENWQLYRTNIRTKKTVCLTPFESVQVQILDRNKEIPNDLIITMNKDNPQLHDVYNLNVMTGEIKLLEKNPGNVTDWITDYNLNIIGALTSREDGGFNLIIKKEKNNDYEFLYGWSSDDSANSGPLMISKDNKFIYMLDSTNSNTTKLVKMSLQDRTQEIIYQDPTYDISWAIIHPDTLNIQMITLTKEREHHVIFDDEIKNDIARIKRLHPEGDFILANRNSKDDIWLIGYTRDVGAVPYYRYDRILKEFSFLFYHQPKLNKFELSSLEAISFTSCDGLTIHGYISFPVGVERKNLPMILNVHGGPWSRDHFGLDYEVQFFTNRGYICLQVNYRGSTGYGKDFTNAGDKEWGGKMQNDLIDAVNFAITNGYADPKRIAIYGGSYGGYAALAASTFTKGIFCCAVDIVGPSNLITFIKSVPVYWKPFISMLHRRIGNPETEEEFLKSKSPYFFADRIKIPILIAQGAHDPRVKKEESEQIVSALKKNNIPYEYIFFEDEGHGFVKPENRLKFYSELEIFLANYLGGLIE
jgi:dipeptidyl aminopeptidase/acylaminoacyl peptidase